LRERATRSQGDDEESSEVTTGRDTFDAAGDDYAARDELRAALAAALGGA
jgi:hypothetical protein